MKDIHCDNLMNNIFYKDAKVKHIRLGSGCYRAKDPANAEEEIRTVIRMGGRPEHDWVELWIEGGGLFLTQKFKDGIEFDEYLYMCDSTPEFIDRTSLGKPKRNGNWLIPRNPNLRIKDVAAWVKSQPNFFHVKRANC